MEFKKKWVKNFGLIESQKLGAGVVAAFFLVSLTYVSTSQTSMIRFPLVNSLLSSSTNAAFTTPAIETITSPQYADPPKIDDSFMGQGNSSTTPDALYERANVPTMSQQADPPKIDDSFMGQGNSSMASIAPYESANVSTMSQQQDTPKIDDISMGQGNSSTTSDAPRERANVPKMSQQLGNSSPTSDAPHETDNVPKMSQPLEVKPPKKPLCDFSNRRSDICDMDGDIRIIGKDSSVISVTPPAVAGSETNESWRIRPYPRKTDRTAMGNVREVSIRSLGSYEEAPRCTVNHTVPAVVFSISGYTGNYFHAFSDVLVPLFLTAYGYDGEVQLLVANYQWWWMNKYRHFFAKLSRHEIIDYDNDGRVHCFSRAVVGLRCHNDLTIDPSAAPGGLSMVDFTRFMRRAYSLDRDSPTPVGPRPGGGKPRLLIIARSRTRRFANVDRIVALADRLGYEVVVAEAGHDIAGFARVVNSCDVMMGVHGAGLTNLVFLPTDAVLIQIVPWGGLDWVASTYFKLPARDMRLKYLQYTITEEESTLTELYPRDHAVFTDPSSYHRLGWDTMRSIYLDQQNVRLDVRRFRPVLKKALHLLRQK